MTQQTINVGAAPNDGTGDPVRTAFTKSNDNFTELYARGGGSVTTPQGRLTLQTATPVMTTTQAAKTSIFYSPYYVGNQVPIWNGTTMTPTTFTELTNVTTASSVGSAGPAAVAASSVYDLFVWSNAGTVTLTRGPAWTNDTTRSAGTALVMVSGVLLNNASITNGPAASRGTYVGTIRSNASSQIDWQFGTAAGVQGWFGVWNCYNRVWVVSTTAEPTSSWTYASGTYRSLNNNAAIRASAVFGLSDEPADAMALVQVDVPGGIGAFMGIGLDTTSANPVGLFGNTSNGIRNVLSARYHSNQFGFHFWQVLEASVGGSATFMGTSAGSLLSGIIFTARM